MSFSDHSSSSGILRHGEIAPSSPPLSEADTAINISSEPSASTSDCPKAKCKKTYSYGDRRDPKKRLEEPCHGYPELANLIVRHPGFESFELFRDLQIKSLLYYQAQLADLRAELHEIEWEDHRSGIEDVKDWCKNAAALMSSKDSDHADQKKTIMQIRGILKEYNEALMQYAKVSELPKADDFNIEGLRRWLSDPRLGDYLIEGPGQDIWGLSSSDDSNIHGKSLKDNFIHMLRSLTIFWPETPPKLESKCKPDLIVPRMKKEEDGFTQWIAKDWLPFWHTLRDKLSREKDQHLPTNSEKKPKRLSISTLTSSLFKSSSHSGTSQRRTSSSSQGSSSEDDPQNCPTISTYKVSRMRKFTSCVTTVIACLLPTAAIAILSTIHTQAKLIGFIALFTAIFAIGLMGLTEAGTSRTDIFTATAAFSAVLVVFVQNNQSSGS